MRAGAALLLVLCTVCNARGEDNTLQRGAPADVSLEDRLKASARTISGTDVRYLIAGFAQLDGTWTRRELAGEEKDAFLVSTIPFGVAERDTRLNIRTSQINAILQTTTGLGELTALAQADLFAYEEGIRPNVTQFAVRLGEWLTVGKTYSTFMDDEGWPATLDYNGPSGAVFSRQIVLRGSLPLSEGLRVEGSLEDPQAESSAGGPSFNASSSADRPDLALRLRYGGDKLHLQLAGLWRKVTYTAQLASGASAQRSVSGNGVSASAAVQLGEDRLLLQWNQGEGIGRYFNDGLSGLGAVYDAGSGLAPLRLRGGYVYYERKWAERWTSTAGVSALRTDSEGQRPASDLRRLDYVSANLVHRVATDLFVGAELLWGRAERVDGARADDTRVQLTARYYIY